MCCSVLPPHSLAISLGIGGVATAKWNLSEVLVASSTGQAEVRKQPHLVGSLSSAMAPGNDAEGVGQDAVGGQVHAV